MSVDDDLDVVTYDLPQEIEEKVKFNADGLVPAIVQENSSGRVLMMAWMDNHALAYTIATKRGTYWSRSRSEYWIKGMTSGHFQKVTSLALDCDGDTVLMEVEQTGAACHTGAHSCFDVTPVFGVPR
ncbi:phosphoribosyl-AMP cyclohydrolase [Corynebacterium ulceribovis]|uniref:phosphoribosyl-AMP cyclohydrolase n=1 Tax=Corynebacterium ulceribovis TaxID=487732 RepID=UPI000377D86E|nr:phosphoribosyl-AMP cyclohydrolase [Corynebacterium ulceribovis]